MTDSIFQEAVLGGGWAMFLLIPASIVAVATTFRGIAVMFGGKAQKNPVESAVEGRAAVEPLLVISMLAPMIGAVAAVWRVASGYFDRDIQPSDFNRIIFSAFVPLAWGVTVGFIAILGYVILRGRLQKLVSAVATTELKTSRPPLVWPTFVALMVATGLCAAAMFQLQIDAVASLPNITLAPPNGSGASAVPSPGTTVLQVNADGFLLNDKPVSDSDLLFRLSALASKSPVIVIKATKDDLPAERLTAALLLVNQAGFTQIGIQ